MSTGSRSNKQARRGQVISESLGKASEAVNSSPAADTTHQDMHATVGKQHPGYTGIRGAKKKET